MSTNYLITGGAGNLALELKPLLLDAGYRVVLWDIVEPPAGVASADCSYVRGDVCDRHHVHEVLHKYRPQVLLHFASLLSGASEADRERAWRLKMDGAFGLFEESLLQNVQDVLRAVMQLVQAPADRLTRRVYNAQSLSPTAAELADAIRQRCDSATLDFEPAAHVADLIDSWPQQFDDASARRDWGWEPAYDLNAMSDDFLAEIRETP